MTIRNLILDGFRSKRFERIPKKFHATSVRWENYIIDVDDVDYYVKENGQLLFEMQQISNTQKNYLTYTIKDAHGNIVEHKQQPYEDAITCADDALGNACSA